MSKGDKVPDTGVFTDEELEKDNIGAAGHDGHQDGDLGGGAPAGVRGHGEILGQLMLQFGFLSPHN